MIWGRLRASQPSGSQYKEGWTIIKWRDPFVKQTRHDVKNSRAFDLMLVVAFPGLSRRHYMLWSSLGCLIVAEVGGCVKSMLDKWLWFCFWRKFIATLCNETYEGFESTWLMIFSWETTIENLTFLRQLVNFRKWKSKQLTSQRQSKDFCRR